VANLWVEQLMVALDQSLDRAFDQLLLLFDDPQLIRRNHDV